VERKEISGGLEISDTWLFNVLLKILACGENLLGLNLTGDV
jgi:hypothetical protein